MKGGAINDLAARRRVRRSFASAPASATASLARPVHLPVAGQERCAAHASSEMKRVRGEHPRIAPVRAAASRPCSDGRRALSALQRREARQRLPLEELERRAAAGRHVRDRVELAGSARAPRPSRRRRRPSCPSSAPSASAIAIVPCANASISKMPIGPFQRTVCAAAISAAKPLRSAGPMSTPSRSSRERVGGDDLRARARVPACRRRCGRRAAARSTPLASARSSVSRARSTLVLLDARRPTGFPCAEERVRHRAADAEDLDALEQVLDDADLVRHLGAAEDGDERRFGVLQHRRQDLDLARAAGSRRALSREVLHHAGGRGVRAVRGAEGVVHVDVASRASCGGERRVVLLLLGVEAQVLEQQQRRRP